MNKHLATIMQKEMTRKEFIATVGFGAASVLGFGSLLRMLTGKNHSLVGNSGGYGSSAYGGRK